jgi:hypothetical protein
VTASSAERPRSTRSGATDFDLLPKWCSQALGLAVHRQLPERVGTDRFAQRKLAESRAHLQPARLEDLSHSGRCHPGRRHPRSGVWPVPRGRGHPRPHRALRQGLPTRRRRPEAQGASAVLPAAWLSGLTKSVRYLGLRRLSHIAECLAPMSWPQPAPLLFVSVVVLLALVAG